MINKNIFKKFLKFILKIIYLVISKQIWNKMITIKIINKFNLYLILKKKNKQNNLILKHKIQNKKLYKLMKIIKIICYKILQNKKIKRISHHFRINNNKCRQLKIN